MKLLLIVSDENLRSFLLSTLRNEGYACKPAERGSTGIVLVEEYSDIDLVIVDVQLSDLTPESFFRKLQEIHPKPVIISILEEENVPKIVSYFELGMDDYIVKPIDVKLLLAIIQKRLEIQNDNSFNEVLTLETLVINPEKIKVSRSGQEIVLTPKEFELLSYLVINQGIVVSREQILGAVWGQDPDVDTRVVDVYVGYLRKKIDLEGEIPLIHTVRGFGYTMKTPSLS